MSVLTFRRSPHAKKFTSDVGMSGGSEINKMVVAKESETDRIYLISINDSTWIQTGKRNIIFRTYVITRN